MKSSFDIWKASSRKIRGHIPLSAPPAACLVTVALAAVLLLAFAGCSRFSSHRPKVSVPIKTSDFFIVTVADNQDLPGLAAKYLGDREKWWQIAALNNVTRVASGDILVIPRRDLHPGGLTPQGYQTVPVLAYLKLAEKKSGRLVVARSVFERQMEFLHQNGYQPVSIDRLVDYLNMKRELPPKAVVITFDNGWRSVYKIAYPILKKYRFPATVFIYTNFIGAPKALTWQQLREMSAHGISIQSQTLSLPNLTRLAPDARLQDHIMTLERELGQSKALIQKNIGKPCNYLAYPFGKTNDLVIAMAKKFGYRAGFTLNRGSNPFFVDNFKIRRSMIYGHYDLNRFAKNLKVFEPLELR